MKKITVLALLILTAIFNSITTYASSTVIVGPDVIHKQYNHILTITDILSLYRSDLGGVSLSEDNYTGYGNVLGVHTLQLYSSDGIVADSHDVSIYVVAELGNVQAVTEYKDIHVRIDQILSPSEIVYVLEKTGYLTISASTQMMILSDTYSENAETPGEYIFEFRMINSAGLDMTYLSKIYVSEDENLFIPGIIFEAPPSWIERAWYSIEIFVYLAIGAIVFMKYMKYKKSRKKGIL
jgi:hypothetical protein